METLHEPTVHVSKKEKMRRKADQEQKKACKNKERLAQFNKKYGDLKTGQCWIEGGDLGNLRISFLLAEDDEVALLIPKLNQLIDDNKEQLRKQKQALITYNDVYNSVPNDFR